MESTRATFWLFLLLNQLPLCPAEGFPTTQTTLSKPEVTPVSGHGPNTLEHINSSLIDTNTTYGNCLIDTQMGLIAVGTAGGLIVCLLIVTVVLACQVYHIQRRLSAPRTSRSNMDLVSSTGYWGTDQPEVEGLVGPCDASVMLEEVREQSNMAELKGLITQVGTGPEEGATAMGFDHEEMTVQMHGSVPSDCSLVVPKDLEDMPLVV